MAGGIIYGRRTPEGPRHSGDIADAFSSWNAEHETWLFISPHDDDVVIGAGITLQAALAEGVAAHVVITTDGRMGYCRLPQRRTITRIRADESREAYRTLGLPLEQLEFLGFPDCNLNPYRGRHFTTIGDPTEMEGASGLQNAFPYIIRRLRPTRVFLPTPTDLHPDHRIVYEEALISLFHAQGNIWPELGQPIAQVPQVYEYATYCDFASPPQIRIVAPPDFLDRKLSAIRAFSSQEQIEVLVEVQRRTGPVEYIREVAFNFYSPEKYADLF
ncbi:MAG: PIG-L family deacetylase [Thermogutta sp.]